MIGQMSITDEHELVPVKTKMKKILDILRDEPSTAVILHDGKGKKMKIAGVITAEEIDAAVSDGKNPKKLKVEDVVLTNILEVPSDVPITRAIEVIQEKGPDAVVVRNRDDGDFAGYFSVDDFHEAKDLVAQQQQRAQQFQQNTQTTMQQSNLQKELEDDDDDDDSYIPEAMRGLPLSPQMKSTFKAQAQSGAKPSGRPKGPPGRPKGPPGRATEPEPEPEPEPVAPAPQGPSRGGPSRPGGGPPGRPPSGGGVTTVTDSGASDSGDVGGHLQVESSGAASGPGPAGNVQRAGPGDPIIDLDIGGAAPGSAGTTGLAADEQACPYCGETIKAAAKKCRFCMEWLDA